MSWRALLAGAAAGAAAIAGGLSATLHDTPAYAVAAGVVFVTVAGGTVVTRNQTAQEARRLSEAATEPATETVGGRVVVSHARTDLPWARWIAQRLNTAGYRAILQTLDVYAAGDDVLLRRAGKAVEAPCLLLLVTDHMIDGESADETRRWVEAITATGRGVERTTVLLLTADAAAAAGWPLESVPIAGLDAETMWNVVHEAVRARTTDSDPGRAAYFAYMQVSFPGSGPRSANLPELNPNFVGRRPELDELHRGLIEAPGPVSRRRVAMTALSGMGKTQIATVFAHRARAHFELVWWINAHQDSDLYASLEALAEQLDVPELQDQQEMLRLLWDRLRTYPGRWLLVYDNAVRRSALPGLMPPDGDGSVLITSQDANWSQHTTYSLELPPMTDEDALGLLRQRTGSPDGATLAAIADRLGCLPLALEQAASYMRETSCPAPRYLEQLEQHLDVMLESGTPLYYNQAARSTFLMASRQATLIEPLSSVLLELLSFLAADAIPRDLIEARDQRPHLPAGLGEALLEGIPYDGAIRAARTYSLISVNSTHFAMHRLVQELIRNSLTVDANAERAEAVVRLLVNRFPDDPDDTGTWDRCVELLPHGSSVLDLRGIGSPQAARLARRVGEYLRVRGAFDGATKRLSAALAVQERLAPVDQTERAATLLALARVRFRQARLDDARRLAEESLRLREDAYGADDERVADVLDELTQILLELSALPSAREAAERSLRIRETAGAAPMPLVRSRENLGLVLWRLGQWYDALLHHLEALDLHTTSASADHSSTGRTHTLLGLVLRDLAGTDPAMLVLAERELAQAQRMLTAAFGGDHPDTASAGVHHADVIRRRAVIAERAGDHDEARSLRDAAGEAFDRIMAGRAMAGPHPGRACGLVRQAHLLNNLGDPVAARAKAHEALGIYITHYGKNHPYAAEALTRLGSIEYALHDSDEALRVMEEARRIYLHTYGADHPYIAQIDAFLADPAAGGRD